MQVILKKDIEKLGYADEIVDVRPGYANNYLIPQGYAISATASAKKVLAETLKQRAVSYTHLDVYKRQQFLLAYHTIAHLASFLKRATILV